jgi:dolichyl-phosphate-mannose--protein O-mannosyl transferase
MSVFEVAMLLCFGAAWPFSIYKSWKSRRTGGKSVVFLFIVISGYAFGILNKVFHAFDAVVSLYALNALMVSIDAVLWFRNRRLERRADGA